LDPWASSEEVDHEYGIKLCDECMDDYDAVIMAVAHEQYTKMNSSDFAKIMGDRPILFDLKSLYERENMEDLEYWRL